MSNIAAISARAHRAGHVAMLANGHRAAWQVKPLVDATPTFVVETFATEYVTKSHKGNRAWGPPSA
jgi:hypothetical protein